jgi:hypothetical protein
VENVWKRSIVLPPFWQRQTFDPSCRYQSSGCLSTPQLSIGI